MKPQTIAEKILSRRVGSAVEAGEFVLVDVDSAMATDGSAPMAIDLFSRLGGPVKFPDRIILVQDHYVPCPNDKVAGLLGIMEDFAGNHGVTLYKGGEGICHRLMPEKGHVRPGSVVVGADSHSTTYGALNAFGTGIGSSDFACALYTGKIWFQVPATIKVNLVGKLPSGVFAKDLALSIVGRIGADGGTYRALEFSGSGVDSLSMEDRFTICNMGVETGGKVAIMPCDEVTRAWVRSNPYLDGDALVDATEADDGADYLSALEIDLGQIVPSLATPHRVDQVSPVSDWAHQAITSAVIGTCTNGSIDDMRIVAKILANNPLADNVRLLVVPPSRQILKQALDEGLISLFVERGAVIVAPGCGPCCGALNGVPGEGEVVISTANRNYKGRMGNVKAEIFLASPATVAASAVTGCITDPRGYLND